MKKSEVYLPSNDGKNQLHTVIWEPDTEYPRAILQIVHGMCEYVDRYDDFANYLTQNGFAVIGNDHLGHGKSVKRNDDWQSEYVFRTFWCRKIDISKCNGTCFTFKN